MRFFNRHVDWFAFLTEHYFAFGQRGHNPYTRSLHLNEDGRIHFGVNEDSRNEYYWRLNDRELLFLNDEQEVTTSYTLPNSLQEPMIGNFILDDVIEHELRPVSLVTATDELTAKQTAFVKSRFFELKQSVTDASRRSMSVTHHRLIRVGFILNAVETLDASIPLIRALQNDERFEVKVVTLNRIFRGQEQAETRQLLETKLTHLEIPFVRTEGSNSYDVAARLKDWAPEFIFRQSEWDQDFPSEFSIRQLYWTRVGHISYVITENLVKTPNIDLPFFMLDYYEKIWRYFVANELTNESKKLLAQTFISEDVFAPIGSIKAIQIRDIAPHWPVETQAKKVIWMPHHSIGNEWFAFGTFDMNYEMIYEWAKAHPEISIVLNPHPSLPAVIEAGTGDITFEEFEAFLEKWEALPNTTYFIHQESYSAVAAGDVILTDGISVLYEAQILRKPIVYLENQAHVELTEFGEQLIRGVHRQPIFEEALKQVMTLLDTPDPLLPYQVENTAPWLANEHPENAIIDAMIDELR
ncbi:hypothetical protein H9L19_07515 [Weissella diestrammenae]|uniref:CDP-glycerol glycerophosphotransferase family protein n=1 Tax=Weissella diestrammenae TaxID=1162633 RepID=A0A7G9T530_9LACO|nr:hypothetical protein [Weissella diestrammenae]MCM0583058.1 hypothetical protein [Weissella diestrammenae]QNN75205.1 hypothetical protein H9L19_07515 [Weissella diestrammenae]